MIEEVEDVEAPGDGTHKEEVPAGPVQPSAEQTYKPIAEQTYKLAFFPDASSVLGDWSPWSPCTTTRFWENHAGCNEACLRVCEDLNSMLKSESFWFRVMRLGFAVDNKKLSLVLVESQDGVDVKRIKNYILL